jgi:type II secretory pathway pseudopilin PulG
MAITDRRIGTQIYGGKAPTAYTVAKPGISLAQKAARERRAAELAGRTLREQQEEAARRVKTYENVRPSPAEWQPGMIVAETDDTFETLARKTRASVSEFIQANKDVTEIHADAAYNIPSPPPAFTDPVFETAPMSPEGIVYPDAMNPELFAQYGQTMGTEEFDYEGLGIGKYYQQGYFEDVENVEDLYGAVAEFRKDISKRQYDLEELYGQSITEREAIQKDLDRGKYYQEGMFEMPGMPVKYRWEQDEQGNWVDRGPEAAFDALYEINGIDPNDPNMIEWFWGFADDDLLFMGEFLDVIEWPTGGGRGGGGGYGTTPTPSRQYGGRGQTPSPRGDYASYLSLTSWSI